MSKIKAKLEEQKKFYQALEEYHTKHGPVFDHLLAEMEKIGVTVVSESLYSVDLTVNCSGDKFKLAALIGMLRRNGFNSASRPKKGEITYCANWRNDNDATLYLSFSGTSCRRVKVGTKTIEQDVFETVCDELVLDEPETEAVTP